GQRRDSGVHVVPLDTQSDSDVKMVSEPDSAVPLGEHSGKAASDSNVRLEHQGPTSSKIRKPPSKPLDEPMLTDEIDLDGELRKAEETSKGRGAAGKGKSKVAPTQPQLPTTSPFELSESDLDVPLPEKANKPPSSSDFDLTPAAALPDSSPVEPS